MINKLKLINFRRFENINFNFTNNLVIIVGNNAVGKTSILESIYAVSTTKSHKTDDFKEMIKDKAPFCHVLLDTNRHYELVFSNQGKRVSIDKLEYKKISDFAGNLKCVLFSPDDMYLLQGNKSLRRSFLDLEISLIQKKYLNNINNYKKILKQRNDLLKVYDTSKELVLQVLTNQLIEIAKYIIDERDKFIVNLNEKLDKVVNKLKLNEKLELVYNPSCSSLKIEDIFKVKQTYDILTKVTNYGPHRDDFSVLLNGKNTNIYASQGQTRSAVLSIKIALLEVIKEVNKQDVILLLDDVFSELDDRRQMNLVSYLLNLKQTFITTTNIHSIPDELKNMAQVIEIKE